MQKVRWVVTKFLPTLLKEKRVTLLKYTYWQDDEMWLGYLEDYPDYMTQGETKEELQENIKDIYQELINGTIPSEA